MGHDKGRFFGFQAGSDVAPAFDRPSPNVLNRFALRHLNGLWTVFPGVQQFRPSITDFRFQLPFPEAVSDFYQSFRLAQRDVGMGLENDFSCFGWPRHGAAPGPIDRHIAQKVSCSSGLAATVVIERDVDLTLETPGFVPICFSVADQNQSGTIAFGGKGLEVRGVVQAFDLHLRTLAPNAGAQIKN